MAQVISQEEYRNIALDYSAAYDRFFEPSDFLYDAVYRVVLLQVVIPEVDLVNPFYDAYNIRFQNSDVPDSMLNAVAAINNHVIQRGGFDDVDAYLDSGSGITVPANWAALCTLAGFSIDAGNIDP